MPPYFRKKRIFLALSSHLTPSNTGIKNPKRIIENVEWNEEINIETCYVSRTYLTRHGVGKFPSECNKRFINEYMFDKTNVPNPFQDTLRYGTLDLGELYSRCSNDIGNFGDKKSIAITHCNEYDWDNDKLIELFKDCNFICFRHILVHNKKLSF